MKKMQESSSSSNEQVISEVDNKYTSSEQDDFEDERHQVLNADVDIGDELNKEKVITARKSYKGNFSTIKEEAYECPYGACGRKFVSAD